MLRLVLAAALAATAGCRQIVINAKDPPAPAVAPPAPQKASFILDTTKSTGLQTEMLTEMLQAFNKGAGYDVLIIPLPSTAPTSSVAWADDASRLESGICLGAQRAGKPPTMLLQLSAAYATAHLRDLGRLSSTAFYSAFAHCIGHGLGFAHATPGNDVMNPDFTQTKDFASFYAKVPNVMFQPAD